MTRQFRLLGCEPEAPLIWQSLLRLADSNVYARPSLSADVLPVALSVLGLRMAPPPVQALGVR